MKKGNSAYRLFGNMKYAFSLLMQDSPADTLCMLLTPLTQGGIGCAGARSYPG